MESLPRFVLEFCTLKKDINSKEDLTILVTSFYEKVRKNPEIGFIFDDIAKVNWDVHTPIIIEFWEGVLFQSGNYRNNPIAIHKHVNSLFPLEKKHFEEWLRLWNATVDEMFEGNNAELIKQRARSIATVIQIKIRET